MIRRLFVIYALVFNIRLMIKRPCYAKIIQRLYGVEMHINIIINRFLRNEE